jgi:hypothetical protein
VGERERGEEGGREGREREERGGGESGAFIMWQIPAVVGVCGKRSGQATNLVFLHQLW